jgi:hypothetical protein
MEGTVHPVKTYFTEGDVIPSTIRKSSKNEY